jgi:ABC-type polysaccharide/polyol phosphate export permease
VVGGLRAALLEGHLAPEPGDLVALAVAVLMFVLGRWMFRRLSPYFEDFV